LVEIHLQGVSSIQASDFILAPTAPLIVADSAAIDPAATMAYDATIVPTTITDVLSATVVSDGALVASASSTTHTTMVHTASLHDGSDASRDKVGSIDERTVSIGHAVDDTVITLPSGQSVNLLHVLLTTQMDTGFVFDHMPAFDRTDATAIGHD